MFKVFYLSVALLLALPSAVVAEIYKCADAKGTVKYQNFPCELDTIGSSATAAPPRDAAAAPATAPTVPSARGQAAYVPPGVTPAASKQAEGKPDPRVGMTRRQVRRLSWGEPIDITRSPTSEGEIEIWTYADARTVQFGEDGRVSGFQR